MLLRHIIGRHETFLTTYHMNTLLELHHVVKVTLNQIFSLLLLTVMLTEIVLQSPLSLDGVQLRWNSHQIRFSLLTLTNQVLLQKLRLTHVLLPQITIINSLPVLSNQQQQPLETIRQSPLIIILIANLQPVNKVQQLALRRFYMPLSIDMHINQVVQKLSNTLVHRVHSHLSAIKTKIDIKLLR